MAVVNWDENLPSGTSAIKLGDDDIRSAFTAIRTGLASEHSWPAGPTAEDRGRHTPNASRVSYGAASKAPADASTPGSGTSGFMYLMTSAPGLLLAYPSTVLSSASVPAGGERAIHADVTRTGANAYFVMSAFTCLSGSSTSYGSNSITFNAIPTVVSTGVDVSVNISNIAAHEILLESYTEAGVASSGDTCHVLAMGLANWS